MNTLRNDNQILPGWTLYFEEVSNNVYHIELTDTHGRQASTTDSNLDQAIQTCEKYAFDIERQVSKEWRSFLFEYGMLKLQDKVTESSGDPKNAFGSWHISTKANILIYDGKDGVLIAQEKNATDLNYKTIALKDLTFDIFKEYIDFIKDGLSRGQ